MHLCIYAYMTSLWIWTDYCIAFGVTETKQVTFWCFIRMDSLDSIYFKYVKAKCMLSEVYAMLCCPLMVNIKRWKCFDWYVSYLRFTVSSIDKICVVLWSMLSTVLTSVSSGMRARQGWGWILKDHLLPGVIRRVL